MLRPNHNHLNLALLPGLPLLVDRLPPLRNRARCFPHNHVLRLPPFRRGAQLRTFPFLRLLLTLPVLHCWCLLRRLRFSRCHGKITIRPLRLAILRAWRLQHLHLQLHHRRLLVLSIHSLLFPVHQHQLHLFAISAPRCQLLKLLPCQHIPSHHFVLPSHVPVHAPHLQAAICLRGHMVENKFLVPLRIQRPLLHACLRFLPTVRQHNVWVAAANHVRFRKVLRSHHQHLHPAPLCLSHTRA
mmetsp:Transcript_52050/g.106113  ORF Transcript_52050/g.106113 Transcript_52050/m.106113 type:complete len:242 (-) Transcript_52050:72-797(-)